MYKTLISDLDGTLLDEDHGISDKTVKLINNLNEKGIKIILATGRNYSDALRVSEKLNFKPSLITSNGAEITNSKGELIYKELLIPEMVKEFMKIDFKKISNEIYFNAIEKDNWTILEKYPEDHVINGWENEEWKSHIKKMEEIDTEDILKVFYIGEHSSLIKLLDEIKNKIHGEFNYAFTLPFCLEIFPKDIDKANALKILAKEEEIDFDNAVSFGDGYNDVNMLNLTKKAYVMGNAPDSLKEKLFNLEVVGKNSEEGMQNKTRELYKDILCL